MTRERHIAILRKIAKVDLETATRVVERIMEELDLEQDESVPVTEPPLLKEVRPSPALDKIPPMESSLIMERDFAANPPTQQQPEVLPSDKQWSEIDLCAFLESQVPNTIQIVPEGGKEPITLHRTIDPLVGIGMAKVTYSQRDANRPTKSVQDISGKEPERMAIDATVSQTFSCYEAVPQVEQKMRAIHLAARQVFRPRPEKIVSTTQIRFGSLSFDNNLTPHDDV